MKLDTAETLASLAIIDDRFSIVPYFEENATHLAIVSRKTGDVLTLSTKTYPTLRRASATLTRNGKKRVAYDITCHRFLAETL